MLSKPCSWPTRLWQVFAQQMMGEQGYLIIDDTVLDKYGEKIFGVSWVWSSRLSKSVLGINVVMMLWTDGRRRVPIGIKVWYKGGPSKIKLAAKMLRWAKKLGLTPQYVVFDNWYSATDILKQLRSYQWHFVTRIKKNRKFGGKALSQHWPHRYGNGRGNLTGGIKVLVVKNGCRYLATSDLSLTIHQVKQLYVMRQQIEEVFKILKDQLAWGKSPAHTKTTQLAHLHLCLMAFCVLQSAAIAQNSTPYQVKRSLLRQAIPTYSLLLQPFIKAA